MNKDFIKTPYSLPPGFNSWEALAEFNKEFKGKSISEIEQEAIKKYIKILKDRLDNSETDWRDIDIVEDYGFGNEWGKLPEFIDLSLEDYNREGNKKD